MHWAARHGQLDLIEKLHQCGAKINLKNRIGDTPLQTAARYHQLEALKLLILKGAGPTYCTREKSRGRIFISRPLLHKNYLGETLLDTALYASMQAPQDKTKSKIFEILLNDITLAKRDNRIFNDLDFLHTLFSRACMLMPKHTSETDYPVLGMIRAKAKFCSMEHRLKGLNSSIDFHEFQPDKSNMSMFERYVESVNASVKKERQLKEANNLIKVFRRRNSASQQVSYL